MGNPRERFPRSPPHFQTYPLKPLVFTRPPGAGTIGFMKALVLERKSEISIRDIIINETLGPGDVRINIHTVGVCGSDVHYYTHGGIGPFIVKEPMILGHEASGTVVETGAKVTDLKPGDRVCMEPGIPDPMSKASLSGMYNLDPSVVFWATPPIHGVMRTSVVHPAAFTFKLPDSVGFGEAAMIEPLAIGMHAAKKASIRPGDTAVVTGAGTIGIVTALAALAGGCSKVIITDVKAAKLDIAAGYKGIIPVDLTTEDAAAKIMDLTDGWGADIVFEASGNPAAATSTFEFICPGGCVVFIGMPVEPVELDIVKAQSLEARIETIFRYANAYPRSLALIESGKIDLKPLITDTYDFDDSIEAYDYAVNPSPSSVKVQIRIAQ
jgi:D-xylulose reductase